MTPHNGYLPNATACGHCGCLHAQTHPCECPRPLVLADEQTPLLIPAIVVWRWLLIGMGCGIMFTVAVFWWR